jgi:hypothetical protein
MDLVVGGVDCQLVELEVMVRPLVVAPRRRSKRLQVGFFVSCSFF